MQKTFSKAHQQYLENNIHSRTSIPELIEAVIDNDKTRYLKIAKLQDVCLCKWCLTPLITSGIDCPACWEVVHRLDELFRLTFTPGGRQLLKRALGKAHIASDREKLHEESVPPGKRLPTSGEISHHLADQLLEQKTHVKKVQNPTLRKPRPL